MWGSLVPIQKGRKNGRAGDLCGGGRRRFRVFGIELLDIRFNRINYNESVRPKIYDRMILKRTAADRGTLPCPKGTARLLKSVGNRVRDLEKIQFGAPRQVEEIRGMADAKATGSLSEKL